MQRVDIINETKNMNFIQGIYKTTSSIERMKGLIGTKDLKHMKGLLIDPCNSIHMFFMKYPIDVVFVSHKNQVVKIVHSIGPWRMTLPCFKAKYAIELESGYIKKSNISIGDSLRIVDV